MQSGTNFSESFTSIYGDDISFLEKTVNDHPASPLPIFLLLQKYKSTNDARFDLLIKKSALYFTNQNWLRFQLMQEESAGESKASNSSSWKVPEVEEDEVTIAEAEEEKNDTPILSKLEVDSSEETFSQNQLAEELEMEPEIIEDKDIHSAIPLPSEVEIEDQNPALDSTAEAEPEEFDIESETISSNKNAVSEAFPDEVPSLEVVTEETSPATVVTEKAEKSEEEPGADIEELSPENIEIKHKNEETDFSAENIKEEVPGAEMTDQSINEIVNIAEPTGNPGGIPSSDSIQPAAEAKEESTEISFEPLHTMDYFASQGIIIKEEALMNDKLGKQMKSFTDWLKSMKNLHPGKLPEQNEVVEKIIQSSAELSNEDAGILTETMAEVLIKQGKRHKAIEMYEKLSLMNPLKSIYFAAKIESLKN